MTTFDASQAFGHLVTGKTDVSQYSAAELEALLRRAAHLDKSQWVRLIAGHMDEIGVLSERDRRDIFGRS